MFGIQSGVKYAIEIQNPETRSVTYKMRYREVILSFGISSQFEFKINNTKCRNGLNLKTASKRWYNEIKC